MIWVPTEALRYKVLDAHHLRGVVGGDWDLNRVPLSSLPKHSAIVQHFVNGVPWQETDLFRNIYAERFARGEWVRGTSTMEALVEQYDRYVPGVFQSLKEQGFLPVNIPTVLIGRDGETMLWNQGNHRVAMAKIIGIERIPCEVICQHEGWGG